MSSFVLAVVAAVAIDGGAIAIALDDGTVWRVADGEWEEIGACPDGEVAELAADAAVAELAADAAVAELAADAAVAELAADAAAAELGVTCGDGTAWRWSESDGWTPVDTWSGGDAAIHDAIGDVPSGAAVAVPLRSWWPQLEVMTRATREDGAAPLYEGWVRLRWDL